MHTDPSTAVRTLAGLAILVAVSLAGTGCGEGSATGPVDEIEGLPRPLSLNEERLVEAGNDFAFELLDRVHGEAPGENLFLAPLSASMALGMTMNGAVGPTFDQMRSTLGFGTLTLEDINQGYRDLIDLLRTLDTRVELGIGNSIWYRQGFPVRSDFLNRTETFFDAVVRELDFSSPGAAGIINNWVKEQTRGKIDQIVDDPVNAATVMFLINAIYFKGDWTVRFPEDETEEAPWTPGSGVHGGTIPLMQVADTFAYTETEMYQAVDLPYGGKAFSMTILLPRETVPVRDVVASLNGSTWGQIVGSLTPREGEVFLPRFRLEWEKVLNGTLRSMGMELPFIPGQADFSGMSDAAAAQELFISKVKQKSYVDVNEEGTEAAAVTVVEMRVTSAGPQPFVFRADRPFLFVIRERFSETILFAGVLVTPP